MKLSVAPARQDKDEPIESGLPVILPSNHSEGCAHCGFPVNRRSSKTSAEPEFCCYGCAFAYQVVQGSGEGRHVSWMLVKLGIAAFLAMNVMGFALALHSSSIYPDFYETLGQGGRAYDHLLRYFLLIMSAPVLFLIGVPLIENIVSEAQKGRWGIDGFIGISVLSAFGVSLINTFRGTGAVYYDVAVMVLVFVTLGRYLEARFRFNANQKLETLLEERQDLAAIQTADGEGMIPVNQLEPGEIVLLRAGSRVPVDGVILEGAGILEMAPMTGEFLPVEKTAGESVLSGALLTEGFLKIRVTHPSRESWLARLKATLDRARLSKAPIEFAADKVIAWMTWISIGFAAAGFYLGYAEHGFMAGVLRALAVMVIICPCALGAAIPLALWKSFQAIVSRSILFKDLGRLETLSKIKGVFFDKTGTLTESFPVLKSTRNLSGFSDLELLKIAASAAQVSAHPFSKALVREALKKRLALEWPLDSRTAAGKGVSGFLQDHGTVLVGNAAFLSSNGVLLDDAHLGASSSTSVLLAAKGNLIGVFVFHESLRPEVKAALYQLKTSRLHTEVLTGDASQSADFLARELRLEVKSALSPQSKHKRVMEWEKRNGPALVIGEGLNDAPMLAGAGVSLAMGDALEKSKDAADFVLPDNDLRSVVWLFETARSTMKRIHGNLFWAFLYNLLAVPLALSGKVNPVFAALLMIFSSFFIIIHSLNFKTRL